MPLWGINFALILFILCSIHIQILCLVLYFYICIKYISDSGTFTLCTIKFLNNFSHTSVQFTIVILTRYNFTSEYKVFTFVILCSGILTGAYFVLDFKLFLLLLQNHIMDFNILVVYYCIPCDPVHYHMVFEFHVCD